MDIRKKVLILGAGASKPYEFPTGIELRNEIAEFCLGYPGTDTGNIISNMHYSDEHIQDFGRELIDSDRTSVDLFLEDRNEYINIGKVLIAYTLIKYEHKKYLFKVYMEPHWYSYLFDKLDTNNIENNKLCILTYNYDRSLEYYLCTTLASRLKINLKDAENLLDDMNIIHLHGKLGNLPYNDSTGREYNNKLTIDNINKCIGDNGIKIIHEDIDDNDFIRAREFIQTADVIYFIGFGYNKVNLNRIGLLHSSESTIYFPDSLKIRGSAFELTELESDRIKKMFVKTPNINIFIDRTNGESLKFLRNNFVF